MGKSVKEIKSKLQEIKDLKEQKQSQKEEFKIIEREIQQQPIQMAHWLICVEEEKEDYEMDDCSLYDFFYEFLFISNN